MKPRGWTLSYLRGGVEEVRSVDSAFAQTSVECARVGEDRIIAQESIRRTYIGGSGRHKVGRYCGDGCHARAHRSLLCVSATTLSVVTANFVAATTVPEVM